MTCNQLNSCTNSNYKNNTIEESILSIAKYEYKFFLSKANVIGVGLGLKVIKDITYDEKCIKVFVSKKYPTNELSPKDIIPKVYKGFKTDIMDIGGVPTITSLQDTIRPTVGGCSIGPNNSYSAGTLGCLVIDKSNTIYILSSNHVLAENKHPIGTPILQTSYFYGGRAPNNIVANLSAYIPILFINGGQEPPNYSDCAIAEIIHHDIALPIISSIGIPTGINNPVLNEIVLKVGESTNLTSGTVQGVGVSTIIHYSPDKRALFLDQIVTSKLFTKGDSGATLLNKNNEIIGLCMSETNKTNFSNTIINVLRSFDVSIYRG